MIAFSVSRNRERFCVAGVGDGGVLTLTASYVNVVDPGPRPRRELDLHVGGIRGDTKQHVRWEGAKLSIGDRIELEIVDAPEVDPPKSVSGARPPETIIANTLGAIQARRKDLLRELKRLDRDEAAYLKTLEARQKRTAAKGKTSRTAKRQTSDRKA